MKTILSALLFATLTACQTPADDRAAPSPADVATTATSPADVATTPEAFGVALLQTLTVTQEGGLAFRDEAGAHRLLGKDFAEAVREMEHLNQSITDGLVPPFRDDTALLDYELVLDADELTTTGSLSAAARCRGACLSGTCCVSGWWIFCWGYGTC